MAINKNHEFEELDGVKCGIVERNVKPERVAFLKELLTYNGFTVVAVPTPPPKTAPAAIPKEARSDDPHLNDSVGQTVGRGEPAPPPTPPPPVPETFTVGVTDITFNPINAIFGRLLKTPNGHFVTQAYWLQQETESHDEIPYYEKNPDFPIL